MTCPGLCFLYDGAVRDLDDKILSVLSVAALFPAFFSVFRNIFSLHSEISQGIHAFIDFKDQISSTATVAAVRSAGGHIKLTAEGNMPVAAFSAFDRNSGCICKLHG